MQGEFHPIPCSSRTLQILSAVLSLLLAGCTRVRWVLPSGGPACKTSMDLLHPGKTLILEPKGKYSRLNSPPLPGGCWRVMQDAAQHTLERRSCIIFRCRGWLQLSWEVQVQQGRRKEMLMDGHRFPSLCRAGRVAQAPS